MSPPFLPRLGALVGLGLTLAPAPAAGQLPPPTVPKGLTQFTVGGTFATYNSRFFRGREEPSLGDFLRERAGANLIPSLATADQLLARLTGLPDQGLNLGRTAGTHLVTMGTAGLGLAYGLTDRLTLFGTLPITRVVVRVQYGLDSTGANAGFNPADPVFGDPAGAGQSAVFFSQFTTALADLQRQLDEGAFDADPSRKALAQQTMAEGTSLRDDLFRLMAAPGQASPFLPTRTSPAGAALLAKIAGFQTVLSGTFAISGFTGTPALPSGRLSDEAFLAFLTNPSGPVAGVLDAPTLNLIGDLEAGLAYALVDQLRRPGGTGVRLAGQLLFRFPTGRLDRPERFFDVGTGDHQVDLELGLIADGVAGPVGARVEAGYTVQTARAQQRRISDPATPVALAASSAALRRNLGDVAAVSVTPFIRVARNLALTGSVGYRHRGTDRFDLLGDQDSIPGAPPELLGRESSATWVELGGGLSYSAPLGSRNGRPQLPLDGRFEVRNVVSATGGRVAKTLTVRTFIRFYARFP